MPLQDDDSKVSYREFSEALRVLRAEQIVRGDEIKSLIIQQSNHAIEHAAINHRSMNDKLSAQDIKLDNAVKSLGSKIDEHTEEDREVEKRVSALEEGHKRLMWVGLAVVPSFLAAWETIKHATGYK